VDVVISEAKILLKGTALLAAIMLVIALIAGYLNSAFIIGALFGCLYTLLNFILMGYAVNKSVTAPSPAKAQAYMAVSYFLRYAITAAVIYIALKAEYLNAVAVIIPLFFPKIIFIFNSIFRKEVNR